MYFVVFATDKDGMESVRAQTRPAHRIYLRKHGHPVRVLLGGPTMDETGKQMNGTMLVIEAESIQEVQSYVSQDPYSKVGLFNSIVIRPWNWGLGMPEE